jgi:arylsulfatase A-like enzyme
MNIRRRHIPSALAAFAVLAAFVLGMAGCASKKAAYKRKGYNVILISLDTLRADRLGCYGYPLPTSPNIDRFALQSVVFENSFSNATWTLPSHMSLMTSLYPFRHRVVDIKTRLSNAEKTLAQVLHKQGYATAAFTAGYMVSAIFGFDRGFDTYKEDYNEKQEEGGKGWRLKQVARRLSFWLNENADRKFFLFVHAYDTHEPFMGHAYLKEFEPEYDGRLNFLNNYADFRSHPDYPKYTVMTNDVMPTINKFYERIINAKKIDMREQDIRHIRALYDNEIRYVDHYFGKLIETLEAKDLMKKTVILLWSDHGEELMERGAIQHGGSVYEELIHVPLIVYLPGYETPVRRPELVQSIDIAPTILDILDLDPVQDFQGFSLFSNKAPKDRYAVIQQIQYDAIRSQTHKLLLDIKNDSVQLFDLKADPGETTDVGTKNPLLVKDLLDRLLNVLGKMCLDDKMKEKLKTLGYLK